MVVCVALQLRLSRFDSGRLLQYKFSEFMEQIITTAISYKVILI
jgi:hypothetical protein